MRTETYDVAVVGAGVTGLSAACFSAQQRKRVLLLEQFEMLHSKGQSYGESRAFSFAYPDRWRTKLAQQSRILWGQVEYLASERIFFQTGGIDLADDERGFITVSKMRETMQACDIDCAVWKFGIIKEKLPIWRLPENAYVLYSPRDGVIKPTNALNALLKLARHFGAAIRDQEPVVRVFPEGSVVDLLTTRGRYRAKNLVVACGAWTNKVISDLGSLPISTSQEQIAYFQPRSNMDVFSIGFFPTWYHHCQPVVYGFPVIGSGIKIGFHYDGLEVDIDACCRAPRPSVTQRLRAYLEKYLPAVAGRHFGERICLYDNTPDREFIVDRLPGIPNILVAAGFSGHGFNSAAAIGFALSNLITDRETAIEISHFGLKRFSALQLSA